MNGITKEIFKYSAIGVSLIFALYILYQVIMGLFTLQTNDLNHMDENVQLQTEAIIRLEASSNMQVELLKDIKEKL